jgi:YVTN family beta-propeller protein
MSQRRCFCGIHSIILKLQLPAIRSSAFFGAFVSWLLTVVSCSAFEHFEARQLHPLELTPDGAWLLAVNSPEGRLSVFAVGAAPVLAAEVPVGLEPVTVRSRTATEAWVVNELSDSVSIVNLTTRTVIRTLAAPDEPADVVFSGNHAFVSCGRANRIAVFDVSSFQKVAEIPLQGVFPRALALNQDASRLYAGFLLSGNKTTTLHFRNAPPQPAPTNPALPEAPQVGLIVSDSDPRIPYQVIDHDVAEIDTSSLQVVRYHEGLGTNILGLTCGPGNTLWTCGSEAKNLIRFEPQLNGMFAESRITITSLNGSNPATNIVNLNPAAVAPVIPAVDKDLSLAQPMALHFDTRISTMWLAAFGTDRVAEIDAAGTILRRIDLRSVSLPELARGPRGIASDPAHSRLFVYNKLSNTISAIDPGSGQVVSEFPLSSHDPVPVDQRRGRGLFFDSRRSGNGTVSCGACHFDADIDGVAWDLGDPGGDMLTVVGYSPSIGRPEAVDRIIHPMKGPMVTQSLRGIAGTGPFHWRGDKARIQDFNASFSNLQAGEQLPATEMDKVASYIESLRNHPNPNRLPDNSLPATLNGGNPAQGRIRFEQLNVCSKCHSGPRGTNHILDDFPSVLTRQPVKNATLEHVYKKVYFTPDEPATLSGFGFTHDGTGRDFPRGHEYPQDRFHLYPNAEADVMAYILCTETGTRPAVGMTSPAPSPVLEGQAVAGHCDVIAHAIIGGERRTFLFHAASGVYLADTAKESGLTGVHLAAIATSVQFTAVAPGNGPALSIDRDGNGILNRDQPPPKLTLDASLQPVSEPVRADWFIESSEDLTHWKPAPGHSPVLPRRFFRMHRTW